MAIGQAQTSGLETKEDLTRPGRQSRQGWVKAAFETLVTEGVENVRVEKLARKLKITKGSFYWHFRDRTDLLDEVLRYWTHEMTQPVIDQATSFTGEPVARLRATIEDIIINERARYDPQVRAWAQNDPHAEKYVKKIDKLRLEFLGSLFRDAGFKKEDAVSRARLLYNYLLGERITTEIEPMATRIRNLPAKIDLLTADLIDCK